MSACLFVMHFKRKILCLVMQVLSMSNGFRTKSSSLLNPLSFPSKLCKGSRSFLIFATLALAQTYNLLSNLREWPHRPFKNQFFVSDIITEYDHIFVLVFKVIYVKTPAHSSLFLNFYLLFVHFLYSYRFIPGVKCKSIRIVLKRKWIK